MKLVCVHLTQSHRRPPSSCSRTQAPSQVAWHLGAAQLASPSLGIGV